MSERNREEVYRGLNLRKAMCIVYWYFCQARMKIERPNSKVTRVDVNYGRNGNSWVYVQGMDGDTPWNAKPDWIDNVRYAVSRSFSGSFAGMIGRTTIEKEPDEAEIDWAFRLMLPFIPSPLPAPKYWCRIEMPVTASKTIISEGDNIEEAKRAALASFSSIGYIGSFETLLYTNRSQVVEVIVEEYKLPELL